MPLNVGPKGPDVRFKPGAKLPKFMGPVKLVRAVMMGFALKLKPPPRSELNPPESEPKPLLKPPRTVFKPLVKPPRFGGLNKALRFGKPPPRRLRSPVLGVPPPPKRPPRSPVLGVPISQDAGRILQHAGRISQDAGRIPQHAGRISQDAGRIPHSAGSIRRVHECPR